MVNRSTLCAAILMLATAVAAKSPQDLMFPDRTSCYARSYSASHLANHPGQRVTKIALRPDFDAPGPFLTLKMTFVLRMVPGDAFQAYAACENEGGDTLFCLLEGDAGGFQITPAKHGAILIEVSSLGMTLENDRAFATLEAKAGDDRSFLLHPVACP